MQVLQHSCRGLHRGPGTRTGSGLYFKWSVGSGPNLLLRVLGLFNFVCNIQVDWRTRDQRQSACVCVCNLQFVKLGWEKCEQEIRWNKKTCAITHYLGCQKQSAGGVIVELQVDSDHDSFMSDVGKKESETKLKRHTCHWTHTCSKV